MRWTAVTFFTTGTGYEREVGRLVGSAAAFNVPLCAYPCPSRGSWRANLNYKSAIILRAMDDFPGKDIVFIDADAVIRAYPSDFDILSETREYDLAACFFSGSKLEKDELLSGTLWVANSPAGRKIVSEWHEIGRRNPLLRHQKALSVALHTKCRDARVWRLKREYTRIFDHPGMKGVVPVIEHFQASRRYRRNLNSTAPARSPFTGIAR
jgi:hypothetical protein